MNLVHSILERAHKRNLFVLLMHPTLLPTHVAKWPTELFLVTRLLKERSDSDDKSCTVTVSEDLTRSLLEYVRSGLFPGGETQYDNRGKDADLDEITPEQRKPGNMIVTYLILGFVLVPGKNKELDQRDLKRQLKWKSGILRVHTSVPM